MPSIAGIASGIDTNSIIKQLLEAASSPIKSMQKKISDHEYRRSQLQLQLAGHSTHHAVVSTCVRHLLIMCRLQLARQVGLLEI